jgi:cbb3-type cytochrome oxidase subunit 1
VHSLVRRFIKTAIAFLFTGLAIGAWMLVRRELFDIAPTMYEISAHTHAILVGFVMMMILGVALWMFPRAPKDDPRYRPSWIRAAWWLATLGTAVRVAGELARPMVATRGARWLVVASGLAQGFGIALFFVAMWPRIRAAGSATREAQGERF